MKSLRSISTVLVALALVLWSTTLVHAADPGVTPTEVKIGTSAGLTGPIAVWGNRMARIGPQTYFNHINEQGGVHGRKITQVLLDDMHLFPRGRVLEHGPGHVQRRP